MKILGALAIGAILVVGAAEAGETRATVVELFTSQGCSSCPPADAFQAELARRKNIVALTFHVDYWDHLGWKDPYAQRANTIRQRAYSRALGGRYVYTPQMVIDGRFDAVGSDRAKVDKLISRAVEQRGPGPEIAIDGPEIRIGSSAVGSGGAIIWLALLQKLGGNKVSSGENNGRKMITTNVVRELRALGTYEGGSARFTLDPAQLPPGCDAAAILVQQPGPGHIFSALAFDLPAR